MATCAPIQDDDFSTFVFSCFAAERGDSCQAGALFGDDQPLCCPADLTSDLTSDLVDPDPDLELPDLDVSDLDTDGFFGALKWYGEQAGFQDKSDDDTEDSLLAALAEGLSSIDGISCLDGIGGLACSPPGGACGGGGDGGSSGDDDEMASLHTLVAAARPIAAETADTPAEDEEEGDEWQELEEKQQQEPSLLKKLLLAPANTQLSFEHRVGGSVRCRGGSSGATAASSSSAQAAVRPHKLPLPLKPKPLLSGRSAPNCTELLRYLCTDEDASPSHSETRATRGGGRPKKAAAATATQPQATQAARITYREAKAPSLSLPLTPNSPGEGKSFSSSFENKTLDRTLSAELSSTAGLTPPTTPPHKQQHLDSLLSFRASKHKQPALSRCESGAAKRVRGSLVVACAGGAAGGAGGRVLEQSELYAQLRKAMVGKPAGQGAGGERRVGKKPSPRLFGDHDYCQAATAAPQCVLIAPPHAGHVHHRQCQRRPTPAAPASVLAVTPAPAAAPAQTLAAAPRPWARQAAPRVRQDSLHSDVSAESCEAAEEAAARRTYDGERLSQCSSSSSSGVFDSDDEDLEEGDAEKLHRSGKTAPPPPQPPCAPARPEPGRESRSAPVSRRNSMCKSPASCGSDGEEGIDARGGGRRERRRTGGREGPPPGAGGGGWGSQPGSPAASPPCRDTPPFVMSSPSSPLQARAHGHDRSRSRSGSPPAYGRFLHHRSRSGSPCWTRFGSPPSQTLLYQHQSRYECDEYERSKREEHRREYEKREIERAKQRERQREKAFEERRVVHVGRLPSDLSRSDLQKRFEVFGDIEECVINLRDNGESYAFLTFRFTCDACAAVQSGHTLSRPGECHLNIGYGGRRLSCRTGYTDLDPTTDDFDPTASKSKYDTMDFDSLLREAQCSLRR